VISGLYNPEISGKLVIQII